MILCTALLAPNAALAVDACTWGYEVGANASGERLLAAGAVWEDRFYVVGGRLFNTTIYDNMWSYDPIGDTWEVLTLLPENVVASCAVGYEGKIFSVGGATGLPFSEIDKLYIYDIQGDTWSQGADLPAKRFNTTCGMLDGKIYSAGGYDSGNQAELYIYDIEQDTWSSGHDMPTVVAGARTRS
ncbi:MAG: kelch repeat-containing protein [Candidatus Alcyoniella australis]|nr:kelch repeat-containing protein [Candidatus Alcyoniella australis]